MAEFVVADSTLDNPNVWYDIGVRHALRGSGAVRTYALETDFVSTSPINACGATRC